MCDLGPRTLFGELAILYNCKRTATIISKTSVTVWVIERAIFQAVVKQAGREDEEERFRFISSVKDLSDVNQIIFLAKVSVVLAPRSETAKNLRLPRRRNV